MPLSKCMFPKGIHKYPYARRTAEFRLLSCWCHKYEEPEFSVIQITEMICLNGQSSGAKDPY